MPEVQRTESPRSAGEYRLLDFVRGCNDPPGPAARARPRSSTGMAPASASSSSLLEQGGSLPRRGNNNNSNPSAERSVSFNRDVHVKRIGRGSPHVSTALAGDGEGRFVTTPVRRDSIKARSKEDLAEEAAHVLRQADSVDCFAYDSASPRKYSSLPVRGRKAKQHHQPDTGRQLSEGPAGTPRPKKNRALLERSHSDAGGTRQPSPTVPNLVPTEHQVRLGRSHSDAGRLLLPRKRSGSDDTARKPLSPIIEASPQVRDQPFQFDPAEPKKPKKHQDEVDRGPTAATAPRHSSMLQHSSRYDHQQRAEESTIHKMIHRLSNDRSPPPQLTRTMVSPGPGFGHNNNRPFSYTRPNDASPPPAQTGPPDQQVIYAQVQLDKKKAAAAAQRSHSDSDEGLGLERKDSSRENSPAEKEYRRADYYNELNSFKSRQYDAAEARIKPAGGGTLFGDFGPSSSVGTIKAPEKPSVYTSSVFVDSGTEAVKQLSKSSELSARRDLLESRIKSRLLADEMFAKSAVGRKPVVTTGVEHGIIDKPIVPSPVVPSGRVGSSPKRYTETYISETRTNSNGEKYIFEKEVREDIEGKVYGYEKKITNRLPVDGSYEPKEGYTVETRTDKYGDKYIVETRTHGDYDDELKATKSPDLYDDDYDYDLCDEDFRTKGLQRRRRLLLLNNNNNNGSEKSSGYTVPSPPLIARKLFGEQRSGLFSKSEPYQPRSKRSFEALRTRSKSTQRLDELSGNGETRVPVHRAHGLTRSHENLSSAVDYVNVGSPSRFPKRRLDKLREGPHDDYDTDISQATNSQLESATSSAVKYNYRHHHQQQLSSKRGLQDDYDSSGSPPRLLRNGYSSSRYDSDTTAPRDSVRYHHRDHNQRIIPEEDPKRPMRRSRNRLDYVEQEGGTGGPPQRPPRAHHHARHHHHHHQREASRLSDPERKDRLADSGIENDYRRDSQEADGGRTGRVEALESEDEGFVTTQFIKQERRHTDRSMTPCSASGTPSSSEKQRRYDKYVVYYDKQVVGGHNNHQPLTAKPPSGADVKKYEKKAAKKSGTMSKVKELFRKKEKKAKEEKSKGKYARSGGSSGALTDDEVTMRYREYRGDQLRNARSARDLESEINEDEYRQRRRLSTPSGSPSPPRPSRLSRSTGTLTRPDQFRSELKGSRDRQDQDVERKGWFKSLSRKTKSSAKPVDKKPRIPESEILTTGTEDEEASSAPERTLVQKNLRFFGDTDLESISSNRDRRNKRAEDHAKVRREITNSSRHPMGIVLPARKSSRLAESALSSGESTTGDSSQQSQNSQRSQRSVVYLHAATVPIPYVGEIPGPNERRRAASREELSRPLAAHTRTVSRSVSVLTPWRPRHLREPYEINYDQQQLHANGKQQQQQPTTMRRRQRSRETLGRRGKEPRRSSKDATTKSGTMNRSTLKSKDKQKVDRTVSTESLASKSRNVDTRPELNRSTSVPRDPNKSAGWFKLKSKKSRA